MVLGIVVGIVIGAAAAPYLARMVAAWELPCPWYYPSCPGSVPLGAAFSFNWTASNHSGTDFQYVFIVRDVTSPDSTGGGILRYANLTFAFFDDHGISIGPDGRWTFTLTGSNLTISTPMGRGFPSDANFGLFPVASGEVWTVTESELSLSGGSMVVAGGGAFTGTVSARIA